MKVCGDLGQWREVRQTLSEPVGLVATLGALHAGHAALIKRSVEECASTVVTVFLNPTQFNDPKDLTNYPSTLEADLEMARELGADCVLAPEYDDLYADGFRYQVQEQTFSRELCGAHRDGHFTGVLTVVMKLLNLVRPRRAYFGEKDFQQYLLIRDMCDTFFMDVEIVPCPTVREPDGLALSSRNALLDASARQLAPALNRLITSDCSDAQVADSLEREGFVVDYVQSRAGRRFAAVTVHCGNGAVRLIANVPVSGA